MATTLIGTLRPHAKGVHVQENIYNVMDVVTSADGSRAYMAVQDVPANIPLGNTDFWCVYTDMSGVKTAMEAAAARADASAASANDAILNLTDYTAEYALRVRGEIAESAGNPVTIAPDEGSLIRPVTVFSPKQAGEGTPSPDNVRPISGYDALGLTWCGKNLLGGQFMDNYAAGVVGESIITYYSEGRNAMMDIPLAPGTYTVSGSDAVVPVYIHDKDRIPDYRYTHNYGIELPYTFTLTEPAYFSLHCSTAEKNTVQLECGDAATAYEAPRIQIYAAQPGQTVYGGRMDWNTGVLTVNLCKITFDGVTPGARVNRTDPGVTHYAYMDAVEMPYPIKPGGLCISNKTTGSIYLVLGFGIPESLTGCVPGDDPLTVADKYNAVLKAWYDAGDPLEFVYEMAEPIIIRLTPRQMLALKGANTLYGDGDSIETIWVKPLETSINERMEAVLRRIEALEG